MNHGHLFSEGRLLHTFSPANTHTERAWCCRHASASLSSQAWKDWFSFLRLFWAFQAACVWTICTCCQVCFNISSAPAVLMDRLWVVSTAMVKCGQAGDVRVSLSKKNNKCVWVSFEVCSESLFPSLLSWEVGSGVNEWSVPDSAFFIHTGGLWWSKLWHLAALSSPEPCFLSISLT